MSGAPHNHDEHDVTLSSDSVREIASATTTAFNPEQVMPFESEGLDPAMEAALSVAIEPDTDFNPYERRAAEPLRPCLSNPIGRRSWSSPPRIPFSTHLW